MLLAGLYEVTSMDESGEGRVGDDTIYSRRGQQDLPDSTWNTAEFP